MKIPNNIQKEHLLKAIEEIDAKGIPNDAVSKYYDVVYNGKNYPPKLIVSLANFFANGKVLSRDLFEGGIDTECFNLLKENGFVISEKQNSYFDELLKFIEIAKKQVKGQGTTSEATLFKQKSPKKFSGLSLDISFGIGRATSIPWISFLKEGQTTSNGIYPVYLYYIEYEILILAYGISITNTPNISWDLNSKQTIQEFFKNNNLGNVPKYGNSFVYKKYDLKSKLSKKEVDDDLSSILGIYKNTLNNLGTSKMSTKLISGNDQIAELFHSACENSGLIFNQKLIHRFIASLCAKPFVICSGLSGSGKTKLAQAFAHWISKDKSQYEIIPVGADWTNREPLLGYPNALKKDEYVSPENGVLDLIIRAKQNFDKVNEPTKPYFLILDEMNLSHVERYFADFLSAMESGEEISLHKIGASSQLIPRSIILPKNLFIIGTVNIDETTYMFSPKVLDRANTIEFRLNTEDLVHYINNDINLNMDVINSNSKGTNIGESFMEMVLKRTDKNLKDFENDLILFFSELKKSGSEFGYRTASEIGRLMSMLELLGEKGDNLLDIAIMQKLLPKLHGSRNKLTKVLPVLGGFCLKKTDKIKEEYLDKFVNNLISEREINLDANVKYKISFEKICRMYKNAVENGFASYAEA